MLVRGKVILLNKIIVFKLQLLINERMKKKEIELLILEEKLLKIDYGTINFK